MSDAIAKVPEALLPLVSLIADLVVERLAGLSQQTPNEATIDQSASPLGPRKHCETARRRLREGKPGAALVGRRWLLSPQAVQEALAEQSRAAKRSPIRGRAAGAPSKTPRLDALRGEGGE